MASGSPSVPLLRRGLISCLHSSSCRADDAPPLLSDEDLGEATRQLISGFYDEAFDRLPCETMPELCHLLNTGGGLCLGLLDPVSNIILNTVALLPHAAAPPAAKRPKRSWDAIPSYGSLLDFLVSYFGCLTMEQAVRYLYWARADLPLAVMLVQHDLYQQPQVLDPASPRTQAALKWAAREARHPAPDILVRVMTTRLHAHAVALLKKHFQVADQDHRVPLTSQDVRAIHRLLHGQGHRDFADITTTSVDVSPDGSTVTTTTTIVRRAVGRITSLRPIYDMVDKLSSCLTKAYDQKHTLKTPCGHACEYTQSLNMYLHGMIHDFYIKAIMVLLPTPSGSLMRSILMAGHCYGSMDPVSNIIVNSIWHNKRGCPLPESDHNDIEPCTDIFDSLSLLRTQLSSLKGLIKLAAFAAADPKSSMATCALQKLCSAKCDIIDMLSSPSSSTQRFENKNPFHEASMAAQHPLPLHLGELHRQLLLMPVQKTKLLSLITQAQTSSTEFPVDEIASILDTFLSGSKAPTLVLVQAPKLCAEALRMVSRYRSNYESRRNFFRPRIERVLREYCSHHFWEQKYSLDFIFGVEKSKRSTTFTICYHVNFVATCDLQLQRMLFFAELWFTHEPKQDFCCPLPYPYAGRCYYDEHAARKIVYPDRAEYFKHDVTREGTGSMGDILEMDLVLLSSERDVALAKDLNARNTASVML